MLMKTTILDNRPGIGRCYKDIHSEAVIHLTTCRYRKLQLDLFQVLLYGILEDSLTHPTARTLQRSIDCGTGMILIRI